MESPTMKKKNGVYELFLLLSLALTLSAGNEELSFQGNGLQVYHITAERSQGESNEFKLWFRTKQLTGMLMMIQNGDGSFTLVGMYEGKLRCMFINDCKSPEKWQVAAISDQSLADGRWHKFVLYVKQEMENSVIQCKVDNSKPTNMKINGNLASENDKILLLAGLPNSHQIPELSANCFPEVLNYSGCIADLEINLISSHGHTRRLNTSLAKQYGEVSSRCTEAEHSVVSIADKNSKILLVIKDDNRFNTSFEFQIKTRESWAFVGKIVNELVTALFFLEEGKMKVSAKFEYIIGHKGDFVDMTSSGFPLSDNHWHKVTFNVAMGTGASLLIDDDLEAEYKINYQAPSSLTDANKGESHITLRFGRSARKYPSFIGCLRDVYVNNHLSNFSLHHTSKGISVGKCYSSFDNDSPSLRKNKTGNTTILRSTMDTITKSKLLDIRSYVTTNKPATTSAGSSNASGNPLHTATTNVEPRSKSNSRSISKSYSIAAAIAVGLLIIIIVVVFILSDLKTRIQKRREKKAGEENDNAELNNTVEVKDKEGHSSQPRGSLPNLQRISSGDQQPPMNFNLQVSRAYKDSGANVNVENYRSLSRRPEQSPVKVWEERYLSHSPGKAVGSNVLTAPRSYFNNVHMHNTPIGVARSQEKVSAETDNKGASYIPSLDEYISLQKHGFSGSGDCPTVGKRHVADASPQTPKRFNMIYSGHDTLPRPKKASGLSWAYGTRFVRHESSDTDCSDVDSWVGRSRPRGQLTVRPRQLKVLESSEDEKESRRGFSGNHAGRNRRLRTFTEETYKLYSLKEEEREVDFDHRRTFTPNRLRVYCRDHYNLRGRNSNSFVEAAENIAGIGAQAKSLDGYTSSCPESINCLSEKEFEDRGLSMRRSKRLTTHYF